MSPESDANPPTRELLLRALYWLMLVASLSALASASLEGFAIHAPLAAVTLGTLAFSAALVVAGLNVLSIGSVAWLVALLLCAQVELAAVWLRGSPVPAFVLLKKGPAFWANVFHLFGVVTIGLLLISRASTYLLRALLFLIFAYCGAGFAIGLKEGAGLDVTLSGAGPLAALSDPLIQPAYVALTFVLPIAAICALFIWLAALVRRSAETARIAFFTCLWCSVLVAGGAVMADWLHLPSVSWLVAKPVGQGQSDLTYTSPWRRNADGSRVHHLTLGTKAVPAARTVPWAIRATLAGPPRPGETTTMYLSARHAQSGMALAKLERSSLTLLDDGKLVTDFQLERLPPGGAAGSLIVVADLSPGTVEEPNTALPDLQSASIALFDRLPPGWRVGLVAVGAGATVRCPFPSSRRKVLDEMIKPEVAGGHAVLEGLSVARRQLAQSGTELRGILIFSTGADAASRRSTREELLAAQRAGIPVHAVTLTPAPRVPAISGSDLTGDMLVDLARATGGSFVRVERSADLPRAFAEVSGHIAVTHRVTFTRPRQAAPVPRLVRPPTPEITAYPVELEAVAGTRVATSTAPVALASLEIDVVGQPVIESSRSPAAWRARPGDLVDGTYPITVTAVAIDGATATIASSIKVSNHAPSPEILFPLAGGRIHQPVQARFRVRGPMAGKPEAWLDGVPAPLEPRPGTDEHTVFLSPGALGPGLHALRVRATDATSRFAEDQVYFHVQISAVEVALPGLGWGAQIMGPRAIEARVRSVPPEVAVTSVSAYVDRRLLGILTRPPFRFVLDGAAITDGGHQLMVRATNELGFVKDVVVGYKALRSTFGIHFPRLLQGNTITEKTRLVPVFSGIAKPDQVEYRISGKFVPAGPPDFGVEIDPAEHPPGPTRVNVRVLSAGAPIAETILNLDLPRTAELGVPLAAIAGDRCLSEAELAKLTPRVVMDGQPVAPDRVRVVSGNGSVAVMIVADACADMSEGNLMTAERDALSLFIEMQRPGDRAGLVTLSGAARLLARPASDTRAALAQLAAAEPAGSRPVQDGVAQALDALGTARERQAVVVVSSGEDATVDGAAPGSGRSLESVIERAQELGTPVFTIALGYGPRRHAGRGDRALARIAQETGGTHRAIARPSQLSDAVLELLEEVQAQTRLVIRAPAPTADGMHDVQVTLQEPGVVLAVPARVPER